MQILPVLRVRLDIVRRWLSYSHIIYFKLNFRSSKFNTNVSTLQWQIHYQRE